MTDFASGTVYNGGMRVIYADSMILLNFAIDYLLLLAAGKIRSLPLKRWRMALGALFGALFALFCALHPETGPLLKLSGGLITVAIAYWGLGKFLPTALVFLAVAAAFGGAAYAIPALGGGRVSALSSRSLILSFALCYALISLVFKGRARCTPREINCAKLSLRGLEVSFRALRDTGNELTDPSGHPVMTADFSAIAPLFPELGSFDAGDAPGLFMALCALPGMKGRCRLFPCHTASGPGGLLPAFRCDGIFIGTERAPHVYIALVPGPLSPDGSYRAIY